MSASVVSKCLRPIDRYFRFIQLGKINSNKHVFMFKIAGACINTYCRGSSANIRIYLIFLETRLIDLHFAADSMGLSSFIFSGGLRKTFLVRDAL